MKLYDVYDSVTGGLIDCVFANDAAHACIICAWICAHPMMAKLSN
jgi:hypothetical protein